MSPVSLRLAVVLGTDEATCTVVAGERLTVPYAVVFPAPRAERVLPGHLVALAPTPGGAGVTAPGGGEVVVWRWFDAVVLDAADGQVRLWEPLHGEVLATPRDPARLPPPGSRAYASAGLPGADWWVAGPVVARAADADVELDEVRAFFTGHRLWDRLV